MPTALKVFVHFVSSFALHAASFSESGRGRHGEQHFATTRVLSVSAAVRSAADDCAARRHSSISWKSSPASSHKHAHRHRSRSRKTSKRVGRRPRTSRGKGSHWRGGQQSKISPVSLSHISADVSDYGGSDHLTQEDVAKLLRKEKEITALKIQAQKLEEEALNMSMEAEKQANATYNTSEKLVKAQKKAAAELVQRISKATLQAAKLAKKENALTKAVPLEVVKVRRTKPSDAAAKALEKMVKKDKAKLQVKLSDVKKKLKAVVSSSAKKEVKQQSELDLTKQARLWKVLRGAQETRLRLDDRLDSLNVIIKQLLEMALSLRSKTRELLKAAKHPKNKADAKRVLRELKKSSWNAAFVSTKQKSVATLEADLRRRIGKLKHKIDMNLVILKQKKLRQVRLWLRIANGSWEQFVKDLTLQRNFKTEVKRIMSVYAANGVSSDDVMVEVKPGAHKFLVVDVVIVPTRAKLGGTKNEMLTTTRAPAKKASKQPAGAKLGGTKKAALAQTMALAKEAFTGLFGSKSAGTKKKALAQIEKLVKKAKKASKRPAKPKVGGTKKKALVPTKAPAKKASKRPAGPKLGGTKKKALATTKPRAKKPSKRPAGPKPGGTTKKVLADPKASMVAVLNRLISSAEDIGKDLDKKLKTLFKGSKCSVDYISTDKKGKRGIKSSSFST
eukprot:TRINITY_DN29512_c1_g1_i1.p1 TRINITY_DN29512_c1_g1~~TRINITY_DN29512_c1_g1_i1.p1  ORF type:complete len:675 (-),score=134.37 TRINITY_DN29512_c1_g1_i1:105-2129(-)